MHRGITALGAMCTAVVLLASGCGSDHTTTATTADTAALLGPAKVQYFVEGTAPDGVDITIQTPTGTSQQTVHALPMQSQSGAEGLAFTFTRGAFVYLAAQNNSEGGTVTCRITVDGETIAENTTSAGYGIASCEGRADS